MNRVIRTPPELVSSQTASGEWVTFPGGELQGKRPKVLCPICREAVERVLWTRPGGPGTRRSAGETAQARRTLCFQCYRAEFDRDCALKAAGALDTASVERFQTALPFEPVNRPRLEMLKVERTTARTSMLATPSGKLVDRRRQAQIAARHALQRIAASLGSRKATRADHAREMASAIHAAELQLPESWLPFVVAR